MESAGVESGMRSRHLVVDGRRIHCLEWGAADRRPVVLLHGGGQNAHTWDRVCAALSATYRCIALDFRGHGDSEWSYEFRYTPKDYVADLSGVAEAYGLERFGLVGMSLGGFIGMTYGLRHPERIDRLVLVDVIPAANIGLAHRIAARLAEMEALVEASRSVEEAVARVCAAHPRKDRGRLYETILYGTVRGADGRLIWKRDRRRPVDVCALAKHLRSLDRHVAELDCPTLLIKGGESPAFDDAAGQDFAGRLRHGAYCVVPGAGHSVQEDRPEILAPVIRTFLDDPSG